MPNGDPTPSNSPGQRVLIAVLVLATYFLSLGAPFILDDGPNILANDSIRKLGTSFSAPLINFSLAVNYAISEYRVWSYHLLNIIVHAVAALGFMGVIRLGLSVPALRDRYGAVAPRLAFAAALIWSLHPLCTTAVTYIIQRCESVYALATILTVYCALRAWRSGQRVRIWQSLAIVACLAGMSCKESGLIIPVLVLLTDCILCGGSPLRAVRRSAWMYAGFLLATGWLAYRMIAVGIESSGGRADLVSPLAYAVTQCRVVVHYLWLAAWPRNLCLDYAWPQESLSDVYPYVIVVTVVVAAVVWKLSQGRHGALLGARTFKRNLDYTSEPGMWQLVTEQRPLNHRAHGNLGVSLYLRGEIAEAEAPLRRSVELAPNYERGLAGLGAVLADLGRCDQAVPHLTAALRINPDNATARARLAACAGKITDEANRSQ